MDHAGFGHRIAYVSLFPCSTLDMSYCFFNLDIALYLNKQKPVHAFFPPSLSLDGSLRAYLPKNVPLECFLKVIQCTNMDLIIWCKFPWYMVILIWPVCIVVISRFSEYIYSHSIAVSVNLVPAEKFFLNMTWKPQVV